MMSLDKVENVLPESGKSVIGSVCLSTTLLQDPKLHCSFLNLYYKAQFYLGYVSIGLFQLLQNCLRYKHQTWHD